MKTLIDRIPKYILGIKEPITLESHQTALSRDTKLIDLNLDATIDVIAKLGMWCRQPHSWAMVAVNVDL